MDFIRRCICCSILPKNNINVPITHNANSITTDTLSTINVTTDIITTTNTVTTIPVSNIRTHAVLIVTNRYLESFKTEISLLSYLNIISKQDLIIIANSYGIDTNKSVYTIIRNVADKMISIQKSQAINADNFISKLKEQHPGKTLKEIILIKITNLINQIILEDYTVEDAVYRLKEYMQSMYNNQPNNIRQEMHQAFMESIQILYDNIIVDQPENETNNNTNTINTKLDLLINESLCKEDECCICFQKMDIKKFIKTNCNHEYCFECIPKIIKNNKNSGKDVCCPLCRTVINEVTFKDLELFYIMNEINNPIESSP
jgi:hypothetical protein